MIDETNEPSNEEMLESLQEQEAPQEEAQANPEAEEAPSGYQFKSDEDLFGHKLKYKADGKDIEEPIETILKRASQGYHYAQQMAALKKQQEEFSPKLERMGELEQYEKFSQYAKENPEWYNHWQEAWQSRGQGLQSEGEANPVQDIDARVNAILDDKLKTVNEFAQSVEEQKKQAEVEAQDRALMEQVNKTRETYKDIDFDSTDPEDGKSLEYKVLEFQIQNNIPNFDVAFKAFYHDNLVQRQVMSEKEALLKEQQEQSKKGIVKGQSTRSENLDYKNSSYDQITDHAIKQLGFTT